MRNSSCLERRCFILELGRYYIKLAGMSSPYRVSTGIFTTQVMPCGIGVVSASGAALNRRDAWPADQADSPTGAFPVADAESARDRALPVVKLELDPSIIGRTAQHTGAIRGRWK